MSDTSIIKYPRTQHIEGSALQPGDHDLQQIPIQELRGKHAVVEEKLDGANAGISFDAEGQIQLQSRGHFLVGGRSEQHFDLMKRWAAAHQSTLRQILGSRYLMFGEWLYAKHTIFYDALPHYFLEFDVFDKKTETYLGTAERYVLFDRTPVRSVRVITTGSVESIQELRGHVTRSPFITREAVLRLDHAAKAMKLDPERVKGETDLSGQMEGLYLKVEEEGIVKERYKFIRPDFLTAVIESDSHWLSRQIIPNQLLPDTDLFHASR